MNKFKKIIGINVGHDGGCSLLVDGDIVATMAEERLARVKYAYGWVNSLKYCLEQSKINLSDIDLVVFSDYSDKIANGFDGGLSLFGLPKEKCIRVDHHLSHASSTYFTSPFEESLVFVFDAKGNKNSTESVYIARGNNIKKIAENPINNYKKGIVAAYQAFTSYFGWHQNDAGKTMGLSSYGDAKKYSGYPLFNQDKNGLFFNLLENHTARGLELFCKNHNISVPPKFSTDHNEYKDMAAWIQSEFERVVIATINKFQKETRIKNLCMSGGGALNTVCNTKVLQETDIENLHIFPATGDPGQSIGNVLYGYFIYNNNKREISPWRNDYRKSVYGNTDIKKTLLSIQSIVDLVIPRSPRFTYKKVFNIEKITAKLISENKIVGWFQSGSEIGPRALGHRSILCNPGFKDMKEILNDRVKHRESFRPFATSVLLEKMGDFFEFSLESLFMLLVVPVKKNKIREIPAVTHVDGTCRIQTVTKKDDSLYYNLIKEFYKITSIPMILNTSFNLAGEPIVESPMDALRCFLSTKMDYLVMGDYLIEKK